MLKKLILLIGTLGLVATMAAPAGAASAATATAAIQGQVAQVTNTACPDHSNQAEFRELVMAGAFATPSGATHVGTVSIPAGSAITACINGIVLVDGNPLLSEGDIGPGPFTGGGVTSLNGDIDRGGFVTAGAAAAVHFSIDYDVTDLVGSGSASNVSCLGAFAVAPLSQTTLLDDEILGGIACGQVIVP